MYGGTTEKGTACYAAQCAGGSGGSVRLKQAVDTVRAAEPNVVLLDAGDEFQGTLFYTQFKGDVAAEVLDALDYTAFTPGNHEFDDGCGEFRRFAERTHVPVLVANPTLPPVPGGKPLTRPWTVVETRRRNQRSRRKSSASRQAGNFSRKRRCAPRSNDETSVAGSDPASASARPRQSSSTESPE